MFGADGAKTEIHRRGEHRLVHHGVGVERDEEVPVLGVDADAIVVVAVFGRAKLDVDAFAHAGRDEPAAGTLGAEKRGGWEHHVDPARDARGVGDHQTLRVRLTNLVPAEVHDRGTDGKTRVRPDRGVRACDVRDAPGVAR